MKITLAETDDWIDIFFNDICVYSGHEVMPYTLLRILQDYNMCLINVDIETFEWTYDSEKENPRLFGVLLGVHR